MRDSRFLGALRVLVVPVGVVLCGGLGSGCRELLGTEPPGASGGSAAMQPDGAGGARDERGAGGNYASSSGASGGLTGAGESGGLLPRDDAGRPLAPGADAAPGVSPDGPEPPRCPLPAAPAIPELKLTLVANELEEPVLVTSAPGDDSRLFVLEKPGRVRVVSDGSLLAEAFLDITDRVDDSVEEMGLLGLAFHPRFAENRLFYVMYSSAPGGGFNPAHTAVLAEYAADGAEPERALRGERRLMEVAEPQGNHNGGNLAFGPDGMLYLGLGDGGGGGDQHGDIGNGQFLGTLLGKLLRIDVDGRGAGALGQYAVPPGNFAEQNAEALAEIWSFGLRNPWRFSFDSCSGDLYIGDVGQESREEIDFQPASAPAGRNYGWRLMEAELCYEPEAGCDAAAQGISLPIASYARDVGQSITGGYVYRGRRMPELEGTYLYADYLSASFFALRMDGGELAQAPLDITDNLNPGRAVDDIASFGQDAAGELYVVSFDGQVYRIEPE